MSLRAVRHSRIILTALVVGLVVAVGPTTAASAHDQLLESSPTEGQRFEQAPSAVSLTFNSDVLTLGARVVVVDESGKDWVDGDAALDGTIVTAAVPDVLPVGGYQVRWRVVSGDGHPITGIIPFTVGDAQPYQAETADGVASTGQSAATTAPDEQIAENAAGIEQTRTGGLDIGRLVIVGGVGAIAALLVFGALTFIFRRRRGGGDSGAHLS